jgi:hypothetical protein
MHQYVVVCEVGMVSHTDIGEKASTWDMELEQTIRKLDMFSLTQVWFDQGRRTSHAAYSYNFFHLGDAIV